VFGCAPVLHAQAQGDHVSAGTLLIESLAIGREIGDWESIA
jgi:hypothetical protein